MKPFKTLYLLLLILFTGFTASSIHAQACSLTISTTIQDSKCKATGSITVTVNNGSGQYNYIVTSSSFNSTTSSNIIQGLMPGIYSIQVKDIVTGCTVQQNNIVVGGTYQDPRFQLSATDVTCINGSNGSVNVSNVQYGKAPFSYTIIAPSASNIGSNNSTGSFNNLAPGDYYVQLSDSCGGLQTRVITVANYNWWIDSYIVTKPSCGQANISLTLKDNRGNVNTSGTGFTGFLYGVVNGPGDTTWGPAYSFSKAIGTNRSLTLVAKDNCGNVKNVIWTDNVKPSVSGTVSITALTCTGFNAQITGQVNLTSPSYCIFDNAGTQLSCNTTGLFTNINYGSYCIKITDNCYDTVITRCFTVTKPVPSVGSTVSISNLSCTGFTATITGQANLFTPQYCIKNASNVQLSCNSTGVFTNLPYGSYCIYITDACTGIVITRCFTQNKPVPGLSATINISNYTCNTFTAGVGSPVNINNGQYCIYDINNNLIACNTTGIFTGLNYGSYCIQLKNDAACYDTIIKRCFTITKPIPTVSNTVSITSKTCSTFTASITGQANLINPQYCLFDAGNNQLTCNNTGIFTNLAYGSYCIKIKNDPSCYDTTITRCFSATPPIPNVAAAVSISNIACSTFTAKITGQVNLNSPQYCLYDNSNTLVTCNTTGQFDNLAYGSYCIKITNTCYDTTITRCFTTNPVPMSITINSVTSCTIGTTSLVVNISNAIAPYTINIYNPGGLLVSTVSTSSASNTINGLSGLPPASQYKIVVTASCGASATAYVTPNASWVNKSINANSKCPGGQWQNGSGDLLVSASYSGGTIVPTIISKNGTAVSINYSTQSGSNFTFINMEPAVYIIQYALQGCATVLKDTFNLPSYAFPSLSKSAVYQCNNNNFSVSATTIGGMSPFTYEIIGSVPSTPSINQGPQLSPTFSIGNSTTYSVVRLRAIDYCGNATINDASILPLGNTVVTATSDCYYNNITLSVDNIPNASYAWYKKTYPNTLVLIGNSQNFNISYLLPTDTGTYVSIVSVNSGCLTRTSSFTLTGNCGGVLSENGISFSGFPENSNVQLRWNTVMNFDATKFVIERSGDGVNYTAIGSNNAAANNNVAPSQYFFSDINPLSGKSYYRLRIVKSNGTIAYTKLVIISKESNASISVMPNPVVDAFAIKFQQSPAGNYNVCLLGTDGKLVLNNTYAIRNGDIVNIQRPASIVAGVYYLVILNKANNNKEVLKLIFK